MVGSYLVVDELHKHHTMYDKPSYSTCSLPFRSSELRIPSVRIVTPINNQALLRDRRMDDPGHALVEGDEGARHGI